jgi:hypothetical protein
VVRVIDGLRRAMSTQISEIELTGIDHAVAILRLSTRGCGSGSAGTEQAVRAAVLAAAPELASVAIVPAGTLTSPTFVPLDSLVRPPRPDAAKQLAATPAAKLDAAKPRLPSPRPADP